MAEIRNEDLIGCGRFVSVIGGLIGILMICFLPLVCGNGGDAVFWGVTVGLIGLLLAFFYFLASVFWGIFREAIVEKISKIREVEEEIVKRWVVGGIIVVLLLFFHATIGKGCWGSIFVVTKPISGIVVDKETGKPIEGAYVDCNWSGEMASVGGWATGPFGDEIAHKIVKTDVNGKFYFPHLFRFAFFKYYREINVCAYASGYRHPDVSECVRTEHGWKIFEKYSCYAKLVSPTNLRFPIFDEEARRLSTLKNLRFECVKIKGEEEYYKSLSSSGTETNETFREFIINEHENFLQLYPDSKYGPEVHKRIVEEYAIVRSKKLWLKNRDKALKEYQKMIELYSEDHECVKDAKECIKSGEIYFRDK